MRTLHRLSCLLAPAVLAAGACLAAPAPPPGFNVHLVQESGKSRFWRGGAPKRDTLAALAASARQRGVTVTMVDLRKPPYQDDLSGKGGRLSPKAEEAAAKQLGIRYLLISALDRQLPARLQAALKSGDIYMHCMYGVNRTGFATARYARACGVETGRQGLGKRDWQQGE
ncbi:MAG TPA: hypothetical protein VFU47_10875, partial [Armatimonadota bacterium]|nr:hypothetical protein [Armatimonadota bacterium]